MYLLNKIKFSIKLNQIHFKSCTSTYLAPTFVLIGTRRQYCTCFCTNKFYWFKRWGCWGLTWSEETNLPFATSAIETVLAEFRFFLTAKITGYYFVRVKTTCQKLIRVETTGYFFVIFPWRDEFTLRHGSNRNGVSWISIFC